MSSREFLDAVQTVEISNSLVRFEMTLHVVIPREDSSTFGMRTRESRCRDAARFRRIGAGELAFLRREVRLEFGCLRPRNLLRRRRVEERDESGREGVAGCRGVQLGRQGRRRLVLEIVAGLEIWVRRSVREDLLLRMVRHGGILRFVVDGASDGLVCGLESEGSISFDSAIHERVLLDCRLILLLLRILQAQIRLTHSLLGVRTVRRERFVGLGRRGRGHARVPA